MMHFQIKGRENGEVYLVESIHGEIYDWGRRRVRSRDVHILVVERLLLKKKKECDEEEEEWGICDRV
jgi:hypothetical protein